MTEAIESKSKSKAAPTAFEMPKFELPNFEDSQDGNPGCLP